jgi:hypothetical protein
VATGALLHTESFGHAGGSRVLLSPKFTDGVALGLVNQ